LVWRYNTENRPKTVAMLAERAPPADVVVFKRPTQAEPSLVALERTRSNSQERGLFSS
jgi:hypothetical protein